MNTESAVRLIQRMTLCTTITVAAMATESFSLWAAQEIQWQFCKTIIHALTGQSLPLW